MKKYYLTYVEDSSPKIKKFKTKKERKQFIKSFPTDPDGGYWVDLEIDGTIVSHDNYYDDQLS